ncbi:MAG: DUF362 domain-containing protein [Bryobacteraceae bacterium]|nr:DUF362 domain-containing protein [Bryobacteraceae bacterium]
MGIHLSRRDWLAAAAGLAVARPAKSAPTAPVAIARCDSYGPPVHAALAKLFDQIGGLGKIVAGKTVAVKVNLTGGAGIRLWHEPAELAHWTHPDVITATIQLMSRAGARRIRILESFVQDVDPLEEHMLQAGWDPAEMLNAGSKVEMENTGSLGYGKQYHYFAVPNGGHTFKGFRLNHSYADCDVFVSVAKLKEHVTAGITLAMKNCFGNTPATIYGEGAGIDEPARVPNGGRSMLHFGHRQPSKIAPSENDPSSSRDDGYRVPRIVADLVAARPIHLSIVEGIETMTTGEGPWVAEGRARRIHRVKPGLLIVGTNPVTTDAVGAAVMGFDPMADRGTAPFETCDSTLKLAEMHGVGARDLKNIEVIGERIRDVVFPFRNYS